MKLFKVIILLALPLFTINVFANNPEPSDTSYKYVSDDPVLEMIDSLAVSRFLQCSDFTTNTLVLNKYNFAPDFIPSYSDEEYKERIAKLNTASPFPYVYNNFVKDYIDVYAVKNRQLVSRMLGLAQLYFPMFEEILDKYKMPIELKYLAIVESALNPFAVSRCGATGLWQFMFNTSKIYGMEVNSYVDERYDPYKETIAACEYMQDLYNIYGDWSMVLAAYNSGPSNVNKAIRRSHGAVNFWEIKRFLPKETQGYVPAFIAVSYVMNYATEHNIYPSEPRITYHQLDTIELRHSVTFEQISAILKIPQEDLKFLNPVYKKGVIPFIDVPQRLVLPYELVGAFIKNESAIYAYVSPVADIKQQQLLSKLNIPYIKPNPIIIDTNIAVATNNQKQKTDTSLQKPIANTTPPVQKKQTLQTTANQKKQADEFYIVQKGEGFASICNKYGCTIENLLEWNNLKAKVIHPGQKLLVKHYENNDTSVIKTEKIDGAKNTAVNKISQKQNKKIIYHTVQKGDTLWGIASLYKGATVDEIKKLNNIYNSKQLKPGTKIKIILG